MTRLHPRFTNTLTGLRTKQTLPVFSLTHSRNVKPLPYLIWLAPAVALVGPPFLLLPLLLRLPGAQSCKDAYEVCLWLSPGVGLLTLTLLIRWLRANPNHPRGFRVVVGFILATLDLLSPFFFYVLLAIIAGH